MSKIAVIKTGSKQYQVKAKDALRVEKLEGGVGDEIEFDQVLATFSEDGKDVNLGTPQVKDAKVKAKILEQGRANKIRVVHYKSKTRQHTTNGHRQHFTKLEILSVA